MKIYIIDDYLREDIKNTLNRDGYLVKIFKSYEDFDMNGDMNADLYIIDIFLGIDDKEWKGWNIIKKIRSHKVHKPILVISWNCHNTNTMIHGFDLWADDYMNKPIDISELRARVKALLRRPQTIINIEKIKYKHIVLNLTDNILTIKGKEITLNKKEILIAELFLRNAGRLITKFTLIDYVWWTDDISTIKENTINVTLSSFRKKTWPDFNIETKISQGYILN